MDDQNNDTATDPKKLSRRIKAGAVAALVVTVLPISFGLWQQSEYKREADQQARENARNTDQYVRDRCVPLTPIAQADCTRQARREEQGQTRDAHDLYAQRSMALWTSLMGSAAIIGMALSSIGVFLVWTTFREARRTANASIDMVEEARKSTAAAQASAESSLKMANAERAWIFADEFQFGPMENTMLNDERVHNGLAIIPHMKNIGRSPATHVKAWYMHAILPRDFPWPQFPNEDPPNLGDGTALGPTRHASLEPIFLNDAAALEFRQRRTAIFLRICITYNDLQGAERRRTVSSHKVLHNGGTEETPEGVRESIRFLSEGLQEMT
jgi:hypothetical protein